MNTRVPSSVNYPLAVTGTVREVEIGPARPPRLLRKGLDWGFIQGCLASQAFPVDATNFNLKNL